MSARAQPDRWIDAVWLTLMAAESAVVAVLNFHSPHLFHTIDKHLVFRARILRGFYAGVSGLPYAAPPPTFPMWGYGWVLILTTNKALLIALQMAVAIATGWYFVKTLAAVGEATGISALLMRIAMLLCLPWFAYHSIDWSQSLATSALVLSIALLIRAVHYEPKRWALLAASALCFGANLNLASDLYLLPWALAGAYTLVRRCTRRAGAEALAWVATVFLTLVPWMLYTWHAVGAPLITSTNMGHVLLIGLGQDPKHRFDITYADDDPTMHRLLTEALGRDAANRFYASCSFEADLVLRRAFLDRIRRQSRAYFELVAVRFRNVLSGEVGAYGGEFDAAGNAGSFGVGLALRRQLQWHSNTVGHRLQLLTALLLPFAAWLAVRRRPAPAFALVTIVYQYVCCSIAVMQPQYVSNLLLLQLFVCTSAACAFVQLVMKPGAGRAHDGLSGSAEGHGSAHADVHGRSWRLKSRVQ
jgi:hypothetical protein